MSHVARLRGFGFVGDDMGVLLLSIAAVILAGAPVSVALPAREVSAGQVTLSPGDPAPAFSMKGSDGKTYRLADYRGKQVVVLAWFAKAFTGG